MAHWIDHGPCLLWLEESVGPCEKTWRVDVLIDEKNDHHVKFGFLHEHHAMAFKLRWAGVSHDN